MMKAGIVNRDLSWLDFNNRVLDEAADHEVPLLERLKFIAICSSNLDEFFMVRVAGLRRQMESQASATDPSGMTAAEQLAAIKHKVELMTRRQYRYLEKEILPELQEKGALQIVEPQELSSGDRNLLREYFIDEIMPVLTPIAVDPSHPFPIIANGMIEIVVLLKRPGDKGRCRALVEVPKTLPRFIPVGSISGNTMPTLVPIEKVVMEFLGLLLTNCTIVAAFPFRLIRDMDFRVDTDGVVDLLLHVEKELKRRRRRRPIRLELPTGCNQPLREWLVQKLAVENLFIDRIPGMLALNDFFELLDNVQNPELKEPAWPPLPSPLIKKDETVFEAIQRELYIPLFVPFEQFDPVIQLLQEAADDPSVLAIKQTLYRVSGDSPVVSALRRAAENGKQVTVILEVKARFDEERNIGWARHLEEAGVHVIYGIAGLKIHCKALLIVRREENRIRRYLHLATGNYNDKTAKIYIDGGMFTNDPGLCGDISALFNVMTGYSEPPPWQQVAVAPFDLRDKFLELINREARLSTSRQPGSIKAKMNALVDPEVINALLKAAEAGVKIKLVVRGICCLRPGHLTKNIQVVSIVDRFLEHTRMYCFGNRGKPEYFMASADWMPRNLDRRIEVLFPVFDQRIREIIDTLFELQLSDRRKGRWLKGDGTYSAPSRSQRWQHARSQRKSYEYFQQRYQQEKAGREPGKKLQVLRIPPE